MIVDMEELSSATGINDTELLKSFVGDFFKICSKDLERIYDVEATIFCLRESHKGIIIGKGGRKLKGIGKSAREEIEALLGSKVFLQMWVKVKENWRDSDFALSNFGYKDK